MILFQRIVDFFTKKNRPQIVTFTGGMGAQIISAAIYFSLKNKGKVVYADLSYFDKSEHVATVGRLGECSHWSWQLDYFGLSINSFETVGDMAMGCVNLIEDGPIKLSLGLAALREKEIQERFLIAHGIDDLLPVDFLSSYLCVHIRRGDYVNVASHLVTDLEFIGLVKKFSGLVKHVVVVSDSPIQEHIRNAVAESYEQAKFFDDIDVFSSHRIMRNARILICSNSQFSLIAALLNTQALVVLPKQWFAKKDRAIEAPIHDACDFEILGT